MQQLVDDPGKLVLGGERRDMSLLFTDIHGFTTMAEGLDSKDVGRVLNSYLDGMTSAVKKHEGTVDKFIGDAVFALWNAPLDVADYATKAVRCALDMDAFTESFRLKMNAEGIPLSYTRIGVHAGAAAVGNFGSRDRFSYTASGDAVNAASRLEGLNKTFGTRLCVSDAAKVLCHGITFRPIGSVILKGKTEALDVWEPLHDGAVSEDFLARYVGAFDAATHDGRPEAAEPVRRARRGRAGRPAGRLLSRAPARRRNRHQDQDDRKMIFWSAAALVILLITRYWGLALLSDRLAAAAPVSRSATG